MTTDNGEVPADLSPIEAALGRMVCRAGLLEAVVRETGLRLSTTGDERAKFDGQPVGRLVKEIRARAESAAAAGRIPETALTDLDDILDAIDERLESRNAYVHGIWMGRPDGTLMVMNIPRGHEKTFQVRTRPLAVKELGELSEDLNRLADDLYDWAERARRRAPSARAS
ncbi:hypothetical protein ACLGIH_33920 [Streptomyces sp. HMX87]|uniref:hypothetical protein n=1 Tax=Streptomyces sp. HMX87 TaxID=3390849 RepID=UPI003A89C801